MVRVISVHNFVKQEITSVDESVSVAAVPPDILLLAQPNNTILVKDLLASNEPGYTIPTVDQVIKIIYSIQGNYIAALETKVTRNGTRVSYTRVYINWESLKEGNDSFPMRARIAGRVTPLSQSQKGLEMIEIPNQYMPENISCCPISGNLLVSSRNVLNIYLFVTKTHDISKIQFIDFKQLTFDLHISFKPRRHQLVENVIAVQNDEYTHIFRIKSTLPLCSISDKEFSIDESDKTQPKCQKTTPKYKTVHYEKLVEELEKLKLPLLLDGGEEMQKKIRKYIGSDECELEKISASSFPVKHEFPTILLEKSLSEFGGQGMFRQNPFSPAKDLFVNFVTNSTSVTDSKSHYEAVNLCQYRLVPVILGCAPNRKIQEKFSLLIVKPYYSIERSESKIHRHLLESNHFGNLKSIACFFGTQQEGYLQCFECEAAGNEDSVEFENYTTYAFTAPAFDVQMDDCFLHAMTEVGLETYTLRAAKHLLTTGNDVACPSSRDPVCLIGLHPFVNVFRMCKTNGYLTLFANNDESSCTLYQLKFPDTISIWKDFLAAAEENKWDAPSTYCELLGEGHLILKTKLKTPRWIPKRDPSNNQLSHAAILTEPDETNLVNSLYKESCALLGDHHILNGNHETGCCYYAMSGFKVSEITKRIRSLTESIPDKWRQNYNEKDLTKGLIYFLKKTLSFHDRKYYEFVGNREEFYDSEIGNLVTNLMDLLEVEENDSISDLVLDSVVLREFSTDRILKMLKSLLSKSSVPGDKDALSLALMCIQRDQCEQAKSVLLTMSEFKLEKLLLQYYDLLFSNRSPTGTNVFTELSMILIEIYPNVLAIVLSELVTGKRLLSLSKVLKIFMEAMPTRGCKNSSFVLRIVLENYLRSHSEKIECKKIDSKTAEAMKILVRIYLTQLKRTEGTADSAGIEGEGENQPEEVAFAKFRPIYLNQVPPFGPDLKELLFREEENRENDFGPEKGILFKLQCILSFDNLPRECLTEVKNFLTTHENVCGSLSLQILSVSGVREALRLIIDFCPQALSQFSKERIKEREDWKFVVSQLLGKIDGSKEDERMQFFFRQILSEILHHVAENSNVEEIVEIIPREYEEAERYFAMAQNNEQANHLRNLIAITGKQLLASI